MITVLIKKKKEVNFLLKEFNSEKGAKKEFPKQG